MKVLMTADTVGGVLTYACELARSLRDHGITIELATMGGPATEAQRGRLSAMPHVNLHQSDFRLEWMEDPWEDVAAAGNWLRDLHDEVRPDIVHLNNYAHAALDWPVPVLVVGHSCVYSWYHHVRGESAPQAWEPYRRAVTDGLQAADLVAAPTRAMLNDLRRHYGPLRRERVIPNARNQNLFGPAKRARPGSRSDQPFILAAGRIWDEGKGIVRLANVAADLPWPVRIAGSADHPDGGTVSFKNVELLGRLPVAALSAQMSRAEIYALPALYEPFGLSALEAGLSGCALVLGDRPSLREVWSDAALFVDSDVALADALHSLIDDPALRREYGRRALERARTFTLERMAGGYLRAYRDLVSDRNPAPRLRAGPLHHRHRVGST